MFEFVFVVSGAFWLLFSLRLPGGSSSLFYSCYARILAYCLLVILYTVLSALSGALLFELYTLVQFVLSIITYCFALIVLNMLKRGFRRFRLLQAVRSSTSFKGKKFIRFPFGHDTRCSATGGFCLFPPPLLRRGGGNSHKLFLSGKVRRLPGEKLAVCRLAPLRTLTGSPCSSY